MEGLSQTPIEIGGEWSDNCICAPMFCGDVEDRPGFGTRRPDPMESDTDALLAKELHSLSMKEREKVMDEIHGVVESVNEDPTFVAERLVEFDEAIRKIKRKSAYERALFLSPRYVRDPDFRLMFLRADTFDAKKAAGRMILYFQNKLELFAEDKLVKRITLEDLSADDRQELGTGSFQFLTEHDRSGRAICVVVQKLFNYKTWQSKVRRRTVG
jgi:hypothetical protein